MVGAPLSVLFVCTHTSARSQMAAAWLRAHGGDRFDVSSAGTNPRGVHPLAIEVMDEVDIDVSDHASKHIEEAARNRHFDVVVTVCDQARETCPYVPARHRSLHRSFRDPSDVEGPHVARLEAFRDVRGEIRTWIDETFRPA